MGTGLYCTTLFLSASTAGNAEGTNQDDYHMDKFGEKVTIILVISFQNSCNKEVLDLYNPIWLSLFVM